jgi:hypothetical protein
LQENHCSPVKLIKGEGKNVDLRVKNLAASQILSINKMVSAGQSLKGFDSTAKMPGKSCGAERVLVLPLGPCGSKDRFESRDHIHLRRLLDTLSWVSSSRAKSNYLTLPAPNMGYD